MEYVLKKLNCNWVTHNIANISGNVVFHCFFHWHLTFGLLSLTTEQQNFPNSKFKTAIKTVEAFLNAFFLYNLVLPL